MSNQPLSNRSTVATDRSAARVRGAVIRRLIFVAVAVFVTAAVLVSMMATTPSLPVVLADDICGVNPNCADGTASSSLYVDHRTSGLNTPVEPDDGETWEIKAYWYTAITGVLTCDCLQGSTSSVSATVTWDQSTGSWNVSCTGCNSTNGPIKSVAICDDSSARCGSGSSAHSWAYFLVADINQQQGVQCAGALRATWLAKVEYQTLSIDDGDTLNTSSCTEVSAVSPTSQTFSATDYGAFECPFSCSGQSGATTTITYQ